MTKQMKNDDLTVSQEDIEAGAYFPEAKGWLDIGRRRMRYQIGKYIDAIYERSGRRFKFTFPLDTEHAFRMLGGLGYTATRKHLDYFIRHGLMKLPGKDGGRLAWGVENVIDFGMQLERMRYWLPGRHNEKKTVWELQAEAEITLLAAKVASDAEVQALDAEGLVERIAESKDRAYRAELAGYVPIRLYERGERSDEITEELLDQLIDEDNRTQRKALAKAIQKHLAKRSEV